MNTKRWLFAFIFIATSAFTTWATAEKVYKCGTTYSQTPCPGGEQLNLDDARDPLQKKRKDEINQRDAALARSMEKDRIANEKALRAADAKRPFAAPAPAPTQVVVVREEPILITPKRLKQQTYKHKDFVAKIPGSDNPAAKNKPAKKTRSSPKLIAPVP